MSKLYNNLQEQLKTEYKNEAEDCIKIYNKLKEISNGYIWNSHWRVLVCTQYIGQYPNTKLVYKPSAIGAIFLKGL